MASKTVYKRHTAVFRSTYVTYEVNITIDAIKEQNDGLGNKFKCNNN